MSERMPKPGESVAEYRIVRQIGRGGMGAVFEAVHEPTGRRAALKVLHARFSQDPEALARFLTEGRATAAVLHPGIVRVLETGQAPSGACYIAMEYLEGETLSARLKRQGRLGREALVIGARIAEALVEAHKKGIVHRDLKPSNIMLVADEEAEPGPDGEPPVRPKIIDFGIAKMQGEDAEAQQDFRTRTGTMIGTPVYMAPEQCRGVKVSDRTDVYALAVILYQALCGRPPFLSDADGDILAMHILTPPIPLRERDPGIPQKVADLVDRMLAKRDTDRPDMADVAAGLAALAADPVWDADAEAPEPLIVRSQVIEIGPNGAMGEPGRSADTDPVGPDGGGSLHDTHNDAPVPAAMPTGPLYTPARPVVHAELPGPEPHGSDLRGISPKGSTLGTASGQPGGPVIATEPGRRRVWAAVAALCVLLALAGAGMLRARHRVAPLPVPPSIGGVSGSAAGATGPAAPAPPVVTPIVTPLEASSGPAGPGTPPGPVSAPARGPANPAATPNPTDQTGQTGQTGQAGQAAPLAGDKRGPKRPFGKRPFKKPGTNPNANDSTILDFKSNRKIQ